MIKENEVQTMSKEKQIESTDWLTRGMSKEEVEREKQQAIMSVDLELCHTEFESGVGEIYTDYDTTAQKMFAKGYRKQSDNVIELPCNIGDSCYPLPRSRKPIVERKVSRITFTKRNVIIGYYENDGQYRPPLRTRTLGEDVFLTKEEAEAKMKGENK